MKINDNIAALQSYTNLIRSNKKMDSAMLKLSSGYKINGVEEDAAGTSISNKLRNQIKGLDMAARNTMDGVSMMQVAEGAFSAIHDMLNRVRELSVEAANDTKDDGNGALDANGKPLNSDRQKMQEEVDELMKEIEATAKRTNFNNISILSGIAEDGTLKLQTGPNKGDEMTIKIEDVWKELKQIETDECSSSGSINLADSNRDADGAPIGATEAIRFCDAAIEKISDIRSRMGAYMNRLEQTNVNLNNTSQSTNEALSRIMDTDMALEMTNYTQNNIINQAAMSILGQANQRPQQVLQLFR